jgi:acyl-lipid omega-6 desaturase (Delta-12 desaturase)
VQGVSLGTFAGTRSHAALFNSSRSGPRPWSPSVERRRLSADPQAEESWRRILAPYMKPSIRLSVENVLTSVVPYLALFVAMCFALNVSTWLVLALSIPAAGFLTRTFIVFHDCAHGSFLPSKRANGLLGAALSPVVYMPFACWRHEHAIHHATTGDLDRRGVGDIKTLTIEEYLAAPWWSRLAYRALRNPLILFGLGPFWVILVGPRLVPRGSSRRIRRSVLGTDLAIAVTIALGCLILGWRGFLLVQAPALFLTSAVGIFLFYCQHQFEDTYWQKNDSWSYDDAALQGSSYLKLPGVLRFFTGNIGLHHVHHLSSRIPNYNLVAAHERIAELEQIPTLSLWDAVLTVRLKLWDEQNHRLVTFREARRSRRAAGALTGQPAQALPQQLP